VTMQEFIMSSVTRQFQRLKPQPLHRKTFTFIDLFAGIGGMRLGFEAAGGRCVFSSEWDRYCQKTYQSNFGEVPEGDITKIHADQVPDHDVLVAGFPCQPFSIAGVSKKNSLGRAHGFLDQTQGTLFFDVARIIDRKQPKAFVLENVKNLRSHDKGRTFKVIEETLDALGYNVEHKILDGKHFVPQHRERIFIVGLKRSVFGQDVKFEFPELPPAQKKIRDILEDNVSEKYILSDKLWQYLQDYAEKHRQRGNGFGYGLVDLDGISRTLSARYYKDGSEILIPQENKNPRRLTPRECARLQGFPDDFKIVVSDTQAYKQFGNSVVVPLVEVVAKQLVKTLMKYKHRETEQLTACI
jgi:DNA (cytosine-5)-methyltransferase 1